MSITIDDIAKQCGLSRATVSRVLRNSPNVSKKSRRLVEKVIRDTGYQPNQMAQSLAQGYSNTVALIVGNISSIAQIEITKVIQKGLFEQSLMAWLCNSDYDSALCDEYLDMAVASKLAGAFLITTSPTTKKLKQVVDNGLPVVMVNRRADAVLCDSIIVNDQKSAYQAVNFLMDRGHKNIVLLSVSQDLIAGHNAYLGFKDAIEERGLGFSDRLVYEIDIYAYSDTLKPRHPFDAAQLFQEHPDTTAVISLSYEVLIDFYYQCQSLGKHIPQDLSLVCLDPIQTERIPGLTLTTFGADQRTLGEVAVKQMLSRIQARKDAAQSYSSNIVLEPLQTEGTSVCRLKHGTDEI